jgi:uncharacterized membrane protein YdjX (TVP38/TMEM64 family)
LEERKPSTEVATDSDSHATAVAEMTPAELWAKTKVVFTRLGPVGPMAIIAGSLPAIGTVLLLVLLKKTDIAPWLRSQDGLGIALYVIGYALISGLALCNTYAPSLVGGFAFGLATGGVSAMAGVVMAATGAYLGVRRASGQRVNDLIAEQPKWQAVRDALIGRGFLRTLGVVALIRVGSSPFAVTNLILGSTRVNPVVYLLGTVIGFAPRTLAVVAIGARLSTWNPNAGNKWLVVAGIVLTFIMLGILGTIANHAVQKVTNGKP